MESKNIVLEKSIEFALEIISYSEILEEAKKYVIARQLLRSGTSIGASINESKSCEKLSAIIFTSKKNSK